MSWEEDKEYTESKVVVDPKPPRTPGWLKLLSYAAVGISCLWIGATIQSCNTRSTARYNGELRRKIKEMEKNPVVETVMVPYTVLVPVTEEINKTAPVTDVVATETVKTKKETAPVTDVSETEKPVLKTESPGTEADNSDRISEITNPLTKIPPYKVKPPAPAQYTIYWLDVERSDLAGMTADDFAFFTNYINKKYNTDDNVYFYVRLTDYPDVIFEFFIPTYGMMTANIGISKEDTDDHCYRIEYNSCYMDFDDPSQIKLTGIKKDEYKLPVEDEDEIYYFSEFNEDMFNQIQKFQEHAKFLWG